MSRTRISVCAMSSSGYQCGRRNCDERDDEREREHGDQREQSSACRRAALGWWLARVDRRLDCDVVDHGSAFNARSSPGRTGD